MAITAELQRCLCLRAGGKTFRALSSSDRWILGSHRILSGLYCEVWRDLDILKVKSRKCRVLGWSYQCALIIDGMWKGCNQVPLSGVHWQESAQTETQFHLKRIQIPFNWEHWNGLHGEPGKILKTHWETAGKALSRWQELPSLPADCEMEKLELSSLKQWEGGVCSPERALCLAALPRRAARRPRAALAGLAGELGQLRLRQKDEWEQRDPPPVTVSTESTSSSAPEEHCHMAEFLEVVLFFPAFTKGVLYGLQIIWCLVHLIFFNKFTSMLSTNFS